MGQPIENAAMKEVMDSIDSNMPRPSLMDRIDGVRESGDQDLSIPEGGFFNTDKHGAPINGRGKMSHVLPILLRAQTNFIEAQHVFMHNQGITELVTAQRSFLDSLNECMRLLDASMLASIQEKMIYMYSDALKNFEVI